MRFRNYFLIFIVILIGIFISQSITKNKIKNNIDNSISNTPIIENTPESLIEPKLAYITQERILDADNEPGNWLSYGRNYEEQRFSPLTQINKNNIDDLELEWSFDMNSTRALESTPIVENGIMYSVF